MAKHEKKKPEFSKLMAFIAIVTWELVNVYTLVAMLLTMDLSPLMYVYPSINAVVGLVLGFYFWKARTENVIKLRQLYGRDVEIQPYTQNSSF